ncbi:hypothetical protein M422DRAFT_24695 [Sphaerobolus stellatus SS14]|nr:hypothetical protein M422DRAFT_24695 [Sphaerobolus stellatus SS14]
MPRPARFRWNQGKPIYKIPGPHINFQLRSMHPSRLADYYRTTLQDDVMYMTYHHEFRPRAPKREPNMVYDPEDPYVKHRRNVPRGGSQVGKAPPAVTTAENVIKLERIALHCYVKEALSNKSQLVPVIMAMRALSGETLQGGGNRHREGVQIIKGRKTEGPWKVRPGVPSGCKVEMTGDRMYEFLETLVNFVLPRLREFRGVPLPYPKKNQQTPGGVSGVVSFGLPPQAMPLFPQIEVNVDAYPRLYGFHMHFITNATGQDAQMKARTLLSGFHIPFIRTPY